MGNVRLNCQGMARKSKSLMTGIICTDGTSYISSDAGSAEPTVITHYSKDPMYYQAAFGMGGKAPYYNDSNILMIDDIYLMGASISPMGRDKTKEAFHTTWGGKSFQEQWLTDSDVIKDALKADVRHLHKIAILGLGYGMGAPKMQKTAYENGFIISRKDAQEFYEAYWTLFKEVAKLRDLMAYKVKKFGYIVNDFGLRLTPNKPNKGFNYLIQSSVSGIMHIFTNLFYSRCEAEFVTIIHDELITRVKDEDLERTKAIFDNCVIDLNKMLGWDVPMRMGWKPGKDFYSAH